MAKKRTPRASVKKTRTTRTKKTTGTKKATARKRTAGSKKPVAPTRRKPPARAKKSTRGLKRDVAPSCLFTKVGSARVSAPTGKKVSIVTNDLEGAVLIAKATYNDKALVPDNKAVPKIEFDVLKGPKILQVTLVFSAGFKGRGELREDCGAGASQLLKTVFDDEPTQFLEIEGR